MASSLDNDWIPPNVVRWRGAPGEQQSRGTSKTNSTATNVSINVSSVDSLDELLFCKEQEWKALKLAKELLQNVTVFPVLAAPDFLSLTGPMEAGRTEEQTYY
uniref:Uncharacterized protein n=1 Tax=Plectus sambesii TaxID=2011161 RepID=A0A914XCA1_9BILA